MARRLGLTRARVTQLLDLTLLAPEFQENLLHVESVDGVEPMSEQDVRGAVRSDSWLAQRNAWCLRNRNKSARRGDMLEMLTQTKPGGPIVK